MIPAARLRVLVIAPLRFPIARPHAGGLESAVWSEVAALRAAGHEVTLIGAAGSDFVEPGSIFEIPALEWPDGVVPTDMTYPPSYAARSAPALARALDAVAADPERFDVISNHCLDPLPLRRAAELGVPMVTTLHTPVDDAFVIAHAAAGRGGSVFLSVSEYTRQQWDAAGLASTVVPNGIDPALWPAGPGGDDLVWFGRIVPEKAPHRAVSVARRLGRRLVIAGRIGDHDYADDVLAPVLGPDIELTGALSPTRLARLVGHSAAAISTPAWPEPFGLVAPEALMCGTPVVSFDVGGVPEIARGSDGMRLAPPGDVAAMATQARELIERAGEDPGFRLAIRAAALERFSLPARIARLEGVFQAVAGSGETELIA